MNPGLGALFRTLAFTAHAAMLIVLFVLIRINYGMLTELIEGARAAEDNRAFVRESVFPDRARDRLVTLWLRDVAEVVCAGAVGEGCPEMPEAVRRAKPLVSSPPE